MYLIQKTTFTYEISHMPGGGRLHCLLGGGPASGSSSSSVTSSRDWNPEGLPPSSGGSDETQFLIIIRCLVKRNNKILLALIIKSYVYSIDLRLSCEAVAPSCSWQEASSRSWVQAEVPWEGWPQVLNMEKISISIQ
jgi:hypothetical protein